MDPKNKRKLDPEFQVLMQEKERQLEQAARLRRGEPLTTADDLVGTTLPERVDLLVSFEGDYSDLAALGFEDPAIVEDPETARKIVAGSLPFDRLEDLAALDHVKVIQASRQLEPKLNYSLTDVRIGTLHSGPQPRRGSGVVIGVIDSGIEWRHGAFLKPDKTSRLLAIWDQELTARAGEQGPPAHRGIGVEYSRAQINQALQGQGTVRSHDLDDKGKPDGHGSHVAGIAAGDGSPATCCHGGNTFIGMAPEADLIAVRSTGATTRLIQALNYIFNHPAAAGKPVVVNISLGGNVGAHDGTELDEAAITALVGTAGRAVVVAAGNEADEKQHIRATVPGRPQGQAQGTLDVEFNIAFGTTNSCILDLWYPNGTQLSAQVFSPHANSAVVAHGNQSPFVANPAASANDRVRVQINGNANRPQNNDHNFRIRIPRSANKTQVTGSWRLRLSNTNAAGVVFHAWLNGTGATFDNPTQDSTLTIPATARGAISVANYAGRTSWCDCCPSEDIVKSSSHGPVRANAAANPKPDLAAPGKSITSVKSDPGNLRGDCCSCCTDACCCLYNDKSGTSMAAPHVAGAVALMLEKNPRRTKAQLLTDLTASARPPVPAPGAFDRNRWGAGKLNTQAAVILTPPAAQVPAPGRPSLAPLTTSAIDTTSRNLVPELIGRGAVQAECTWLDLTRACLHGVPDGELIAALISRHFSEVRRLINHQRRVATLWHRSDGPALLRRLMDGAVNADAPPPLAEPSHREALQRFFVLLERFGSVRLCRTLDAHRQTITRMLETPLAAQAAVSAGEEI